MQFLCGKWSYGEYHGMMSLIFFLFWSGGMYIWRCQFVLVFLYYSSYRVSEDMPLYDILNEFQKGHSHIAVVYKDLNEKKEGELFKDNCKKPRGQPEKSSEKGEMDAATFILNCF